MDNVHHPEARAWISAKIKIKDYFAEYKKAIEHHGRGGMSAKKMIEEKKKLSVNHLRMLVENVPAPLPSDGATIQSHQEDEMSTQSFARMSDDMLKEICQSCDIENLRVPGEMPICQPFEEADARPGGEGLTANDKTLPRFAVTPIPIEGLENLRCLQLQHDFLQQATGYDREKRKRTSRYPGNHWFESAPPKGARGRLGMVEDQVLLTVKIYRPVKKDLQQPTLTLNNTRCLQEFHILGSNYLSQLRDLIKCPTDLMTGGDVSENPPWVKKVDTLPPVPSAKDYHLKVIPVKKKEETYFKKVYKSGFFYIEGCFYNDMRWPDCIDYSEVIRNWAEPSKRKIGPFTTAKMEETKIEDLEIRFGYPYVYVHQGEHEHLISFTEGRLVSADDPQRLASYPYERCSGIINSRFCMICSSNVAKWVTTQNERVPEDPFFFCDGCFRDFNYDKRDKKIGHFRAYNFVDVNAL